MKQQEELIRMNNVQSSSRTLYVVHKTEMVRPRKKPVNPKDIAYRLLLSICMCTLLAGCVQSDLVDYSDLKGHYKITPDQTTQALPKMQYHLYNMDGSTPITASCDGNGNYFGQLPPGIYRTIGISSVLQNAEPEGMGSHETAMLRVLPLTVESRADSRYLSSPNEIYTVVLPDATVHVGDTVVRTPQPTQITKQFNFTVSMEEELFDKVSRVDAILRGVYGAVYLYTSLPVETDHEMSVALNPSSGSFAWEMNTRLLGIRDPKHGVTYTNTLTLILEGETMGTEEIDVDLTKLLSEAIEENGGELPAEVPIEIEVTDPNPDPDPDGGIKAGLKATLTPWKDLGNGGGYVPLK